MKRGSPGCSSHPRRRPLYCTWSTSQQDTASEAASSGPSARDIWYLRNQTVTTRHRPCYRPRGCRFFNKCRLLLAAIIFEFCLLGILLHTHWTPVTPGYSSHGAAEHRSLLGFCVTRVTLSSLGTCCGVAVLDRTQQSLLARPKGQETRILNQQNLGPLSEYLWPPDCSGVQIRALDIKLELPSL